MSATRWRWSSPRPTARPRMPARRFRSTTPSSTRSWRSATPTMRGSLVHDEVAEQPDLSTGSSATRRRPTPRSPMPPTSPRSTWSTTGWCRTRWSRAPRSGTTTPAPKPTPATSPARTRTSHRLVMSAFIGVAPEHKLRVVAPDVGGGFGSKIFIYNEECVVTWASKKVGGRPVKWTSDRSEAFLTDAHGRDHVSHAELAHRRPGQHPGAAREHQGEPRRLHVDVLLVDPDLPLRHTARRPVQDPGDLLRRAGLLHQHGAGGRLSRRRAARGLVPARDPDGPGGDRDRAWTRPSSAAATSSPRTPSPTRRRWR